MEWNDTYAILLYLSGKKEETTTSQIAEEVNVSQQTVSRKLKECEETGLINRNVTPQGLTITLTEKGLSLLKKHYHLLHSVFDKEKEVNCTVQSGLGEGKYYMSLPQYKKQFKEKIGYEPYEGTLNVKVEREQVEVFLKRPIHISGFSTTERTFGGLISYPVTLKFNQKKIAAHIVLPERTTHHKDIIEIIAPIRLRDSWKIKDGDILTLQ
ncbi:riboflavin kinase [Candidatus Woesearchaeota archaeon CG10_big_fil_rev_8_21_14_0_10_45_16]|nr:MAG: riboflavin kinase [Candidatus Woesearchaeota archaeon CG10_big_fil_rev_8_21_14_0_10_45_16]